MIEDVLQAAIADRAFPGAAYAILQSGRTVKIGAVGHLTYTADAPATAPETIWDLASVSKVVGTTTAAMLLAEEGQLDLDAPVASVIPEFAQKGKERITFRNLMVHDSGLIAFRRYHEFCANREEILNAIYGEGLEYETQTKTIYSDLSMILVGEAIERLTGQPLDILLRDRVFLPIGMRDTGYLPAGGDWNIDPRRCAPTEKMEAWRRERHARIGDSRPSLVGQGEFIQGEVHDPTAAAMGGVAGHAGLFSTAPDLARFFEAFLGGSLVRTETLAEFTRRQDQKSTRALGWDTKSPEGSSAGALFGPRSFGHTGYTGTSVWHDPDAGLTAILLTNRVHPTSENLKISEVRPRFHDAVFASAA